MFALKKIVVATLAFASNAVFSGAMGPVCSPGDVTTPCEASAWSIGLHALYLEPSYSVGGFTQKLITTSVNPADPTSPTVRTEYPYVAAKDAWGWGFQLDGSYYFKSGNDLNLSWYHLDHATNQLVVMPNKVGNIIFDNLGAAALFSDMNVYVKSKWDAVNLELGQEVDFATWKNIRFHGGFQYANIQTINIDTKAGPFNRPLPLQIIRSTNIMKYYGVGPRIGTDLQYNWNQGFSVYAKGATALLIGKRKFNNTALSSSEISIDGLPPGSIFSMITTGNDTIMVPELEAKAGLSYSCSMGQGRFILDAGWMWTNYFNSLGSKGPIPETISNFAVQGPYAGLKWLGNV